MCLITLQKESLIATEDIICYKTVNIDSGIIISQYQDFKYDLDTLYETEFSITGISEYYKINEGFHSYPEGEYERIKNQNNCVKCIIPKGSEYYIGTFSGHDCYCSNKIIIKEIVSDRNRNQMINGKVEGYWEYYHDNGNLLSKGKYKNNEKEGYWEEYWNNGNLSSKGNYKDGKKDGYWEYYGDNGKLYNEVNYNKGRKGKRKVLGIL